MYKYKINKKGQIGLGDAPSVVLIVGLIFLLMATLAYVGYEFGDSTAIPTTTTAHNETVTGLASAGDTLTNAGLRNVVCTFLTVTNHTGGEDVPATNYTQSNCRIIGTAGSYINEDVNVTYRYSYDLPTTATNVTDALNTQMNNNTSIAGIILTIALVGIVLAILIGVFALVGQRKM